MENELFLYWCKTENMFDVVGNGGDDPIFSIFGGFQDLGHNDSGVSKLVSKPTCCISLWGRRVIVRRFSIWIIIVLVIAGYDITHMHKA